jgi:hypothetical protein
MNNFKSAYKILVCKPEGEGPLGKYTCRGEDIVRLNLIEIC